MDFYKKMVKQLPNCLKDNCLQRIDSIDCKQVQFMCTLNIKRLYTHIPYKEDTEAVVEKLKEEPGLSNEKISFIMTLLETILTKNNFKFGFEYFMQMGSPVAPSFANVFMATFEDLHVHNSSYRCATI